MKNNFIKFLKKTNPRPYIIAEIGSNHNGNLDLCEKQIKLASLAGADAVKFQKFDDNNIFSKISYKKNKLLKISDVKKFSISIEDLKKIEKMCKKHKIELGVTPLSYDDVLLIKKFIKINFFKIASGDANNLNFVKFVANQKKPTIISFGMCNKIEIQNSVNSFLKINKELAIMHCVSIYPTPLSKINLNRIYTLKKMFKNIKVGFSDHSLGITASNSSISMGALLIEKHFTSNKKLQGWDHSMSLDFNELKELCKRSEEISISLGNFTLNRIEDKKILNFFRRSIVLKKNCKKGYIITKNDLDFKRPGTGLSPNDASKIIGKKLLKNKKYDDVLFFKDFQK